MSSNAQETRDWPSLLAGFDHIARIWDRDEDLCASRILPGEYYVTRHEEVITTVLGSCVSACIRDPAIGVGGMNHFMLPGSTGRTLEKWGGEDCLATRYGIAAMENLINDILKQGGRKNRLELKLFGGGKVMAMDINNVGERNIQFAKQFTSSEGLVALVQDFGGPYPRKIKYFPKSGKVMVRRLRSIQKKTVASLERRYEATLDSKEVTGDIELFD
ncbi:MAG: chemoreceptor glutamine deamidase CheD [Gammaproteobacteria bacterium]|nr:chemoreceptor glutamine deamidase CheD [Gammaproteobacteria bacterium]